MNSRDRLIELIRNAIDGCARHWAEIIADHLIANGVIIPPCKVGNTIYRYGDVSKRVYEWQIALIEIYEDEIIFIDYSDNIFTEKDIGKTVFLTREEAEQALKERSDANV